jgi:hypothetical protein
MRLFAQDPSLGPVPTDYFTIQQQSAGAVAENADSPSFTPVPGSVPADNVGFNCDPWKHDPVPGQLIGPSMWHPSQAKRRLGKRLVLEGDGLGYRHA